MAAEASPAAPTTTVTCVKKLSESSNLPLAVASKYAYFNHPDEITASDPQGSIPTIDISLLMADDLDLRSKAIQDLGKACQEWGFFMAVNHGIHEGLLSDIIEISHGFFNLSEEDKPEFEPNNVLEPIRYGTSFNAAKEKVHCWRDFLKVFVHPDFHCPHQPESLRDLLSEYSSRTKTLASILAKGISQSLGLDELEMERALSLESGLRIFVMNLYPPCPQPETALGIAPHSDHGLFTLLIQNGVGGLQIQHNGKWININPVPGSILVNTGDHLEIFSNGKYRSVLHRAVVNNQSTRISIAMTNGPSLDTVVSPSSKLLVAEECAPAYVSMAYREYLLSQQSNKLDGKTMLARVKVENSP